MAFGMAVVRGLREYGTSIGVIMEFGLGLERDAGGLEVFGSTKCIRSVAFIVLVVFLSLPLGFAG